MSFLRSKFLRSVLVGLWFGLLAAPFAGVSKSLWIAAAVAVGGIVILALRSLASAGVFGQLRGAADGIERLLDSFKSGPRRTVAFVAIVVFLAFLPLQANRYTMDLAAQTCIYVMLALGLNIVVGQAGILVLGYVAFYAVGAYVYAILSTGYGVSFWAALPVAAFLVLVLILIIRPQGLLGSRTPDKV